jgi:hypothetical protein
LPTSESKDAGKENEAHICTIHGVEMKKLNKGNQIWYSHKTDTGWCSAKMEYTIGKLLNEIGGIIRQITACVPHLRQWLRLGRAWKKKGWIDKLYINARFLSALRLICFN